MQAENNNFKGAYSICEVSSGGKYHAELGMILSNGLKKGKHDNCTLRPEYFFAKLWTKGIRFVKKKIKIRNNITIEN